MGKRLAATVQPEDIVQHALQAVASSIAHVSFDNEVAFEAWLRVIVRNRIIDLGKGLDRHPPCRSIDEARAAGALPSHGSNAAFGDGLVGRGGLSSHWRREHAQLSIAHVLDRLPKHFATVLRMVRIEGRPTAEVARLLGKQERAVRQLLSRALEKCREVMRGPGPGLGE